MTSLAIVTAWFATRSTDSYQPVSKAVARFLKPYLFQQIFVLDCYLQLLHDVKAEPVNLVVRLDYFLCKLDIIFSQKRRVSRCIDLAISNIRLNAVSTDKSSRLISTCNVMPVAESAMISVPIRTRLMMFLITSLCSTSSPVLFGNNINYVKAKKIESNQLRNKIRVVILADFNCCLLLLFDGSL